MMPYFSFYAMGFYLCALCYILNRYLILERLLLTVVFLSYVAISLMWFMLIMKHKKSMAMISSLTVAYVFFAINLLICMGVI